MAIVIDASAALSLLAPSQVTAASGVFAKQQTALIAPSVFPIEVRHAILRLERRGALPVGAVDASLEQLEAVVELAPIPGEPRIRAAMLALAREEMPGMYDAAYLHLAMARGAPLASRDGPLLAAARRRGVAIHDVR